jgi:hypothetical protein
MQKHSKPNRGQFKKGHDPRRHVHSATCGHRLYQFTDADRSAGFFAAIATMGVGIGDKLRAAGRWPRFEGRGAKR